jgi:hypothetical protein
LPSPTFLALLKINHVRRRTEIFFLLLRIEEEVCPPPKKFCPPKIVCRKTYKRGAKKEKNIIRKLEENPKFDI